jgi:hypothetical protein
MTWILATITSIFGLLIFSMIVSNIILIIFFAIPLTAKLNKACLIKTNNITASYCVALIIQICVLSFVTFIFIKVIKDEYYISLFVGYGLGLLGIITKISSFSLNIMNFTEYFEKNKDYFWPQLVEKYKEDKGELYNYVLESIKS